MKRTNNKQVSAEDTLKFFSPYYALKLMQDLNRYDEGGETLSQKVYQHEGDYRGYTRANGHPIAFDEEGNLVDQVTGGKGTMQTGIADEVVIKGDKTKRKSPTLSFTSPSTFAPSMTMTPEVASHIVKKYSPYLNAASPAAWMDTLYDGLYTPEEVNYPWMEGNKGLGDPLLDLTFDLATTAAVSKGLGIAGKAGMNYKKAVDSNINKVNSFYDLPFVHVYKSPNSKIISEGATVDNAIANPDLFVLPSYAKINSPTENALSYHMARLATNPEYKKILDEVKYIDVSKLTDQQIIDDFAEAVQLFLKEEWGFLPSLEETKRVIAKNYTRKELLNNYRSQSGFAFGHAKHVYYNPDLIKASNESEAVVKSHELDHIINTYIARETPEGFYDGYLAGQEGIITPDYMTDNFGYEFAARGNQLLNYFGLTDYQPLTADMLRYAADNYILDTGMDNNMAEFFTRIVDYDKAAKWLSKYSTAVAAPVGIGGTGIISNNNDRQK